MVQTQKQITPYCSLELGQRKGEASTAKIADGYWTAIQTEKLKDFLEASDAMFQKVLADQHFEEEIGRYLVALVQFKQHVTEQSQKDAPETLSQDTLQPDQP